MLYNQIIRQLINHENEIRDQRNKWQLTIYGFMIAGYVAAFIKQDIYCNNIICLVISFVGLIITFSFFLASCVSNLSISMALSCWNIALERNGERIINYPPVCLITRNIIENNTIPLGDDNIGINEWSTLIHDRLLSRNNQNSIVRELYKFEGLFMPYKIIPIIFGLLWTVFFIISLIRILNA